MLLFFFKVQRFVFSCLSGLMYLPFQPLSHLFLTNLLHHIFHRYHLYCTCTPSIHLQILLSPSSELGVTGLLEPTQLLGLGGVHPEQVSLLPGSHTRTHTLGGFRDSDYGACLWTVGGSRLKKLHTERCQSGFEPVLSQCEKRVLTSAPPCSLSLCPLQIFKETPARFWFSSSTMLVCTRALPHTSPPLQTPEQNKVE